MARIMEPTKAQERGYRKWAASRPPNIRAVAERFDPWSLYRMKSSNHRVTVASFGENEDGTVSMNVIVSGDYNFVMFDREVFGIDPDDLEPCELPPADEVTGTMMTQEQVMENLPALREMAKASRKH